MAEWFRTLDALVEDSIQFPTLTLDGSKLSVTPAP